MTCADEVLSYSMLGGGSEVQKHVLRGEGIVQKCRIWHEQNKPTPDW